MKDKPWNGICPACDQWDNPTKFGLVECSICGVQASTACCALGFEPDDEDCVCSYCLESSLDPMNY